MAGSRLPVIRENRTVRSARYYKGRNDRQRCYRGFTVSKASLNDAQLVRWQMKDAMLYAPRNG